MTQIARGKNAGGQAYQSKPVESGSWFTLPTFSSKATFGAKPSQSEKSAAKPRPRKGYHMKKILLAILMLSVTPGAAFEQTEKKNSEYLAKAAITKLEYDWTNAFVEKDAQALDRFMADDFLMLGQFSTGELIDKNTLIRRSLALLTLLTFSLDDVRIQIHGDTAVFHCKYTFQGIYSGQPYSGVTLVTDTWVRQGDQWQVLARHSGKIPSAK